jgi:tetratricopeptide (TPR) repeat protein
MYDAALRIRDAGHPRDLAHVTAMMRDAPYDYPLAAEYLTTRYGEKPPYDEILRVAGNRRDYDLRVLHLALQHVPGDAERLALLRRSCEVSAAECIALGAEHARRGRDEEAAASYERGFADPSVDEVTMSNAAGWLVSHYFRTRKLEAALQLGERSARTGSFQGLVALASLYERLERWDDAAELHRQAAERYDNPTQLLGFYYRAVNTHKQLEFETAWRHQLAEVFPKGLTPAPKGDARPATGVIVTRDNDFVRKAGLQAGDVIVGVEGWQVEDLRQYYAVNAFFESDVMRLSAWRGKLSPVTLRAPNRLMGVDLRTYPIEGWDEK